MIRRVNFKNIYAAYLPNEEDVPRVRKGKKKRREIVSSTGVNDTIVDTRIAINWLKTKQNELQKNVITKVDHQKKSLFFQIFSKLLKSVFITGIMKFSGINQTKKIFY